MPERSHRGVYQWIFSDHTPDVTEAARALSIIHDGRVIADAAEQTMFSETRDPYDPSLLLTVARVLDPRPIDEHLGAWEGLEAIEHLKAWLESITTPSLVDVAEKRFRDLLARDEARLQDDRFGPDAKAVLSDIRFVISRDPFVTGRWQISIRSRYAGQRERDARGQEAHDRLLRYAHNTLAGMRAAPLVFSSPSETPS